MKTVKKLEVVESCPTSKEEWEIAARRKNCSKLAAEAERKNCIMNEKQPEYHCLINALRNKLLEVCVAGKIIFGYCAEFNEAGLVIQNHYTAPCEDVSPKCDHPYRSSDAYKYPGCYKLVKKTQVSTDLESFGPEFGYNKMEIIIPCIQVAVGCFVAVTAVLFIRRRNEKRQIEKDKEECRRLIESATEKTTNKASAALTAMSSLQISKDCYFKEKNSRKQPENNSRTRRIMQRYPCSGKTDSREDRGVGKETSGDSERFVDCRTGHQVRYTLGDLQLEDASNVQNY